MSHSTLTDNLSIYQAHRDNPLLFRRRSLSTTLWLKFEVWKQNLLARFHN